MSAVYHPQDWADTYAKGFQSVLAYVKTHPGASLDAIATGTSQPYAVVYAACVAAGLVILPSAAGELQWHGQHR